MKMYELGIKVTDLATDLGGVLTHVQLETDMSLVYNFQPKGLNPETGQPVRSMWLKDGRIKGGNIVDVDMSSDMIGSIVVDKASGFGGTVIALIRHINGCVHALVQPKAVVKKTNEPVLAREFDIRRLAGTKVPKFDAPALKKSIAKRPSPAACKPYMPGT